MSRCSVHKHVLKFHRPAGTSRGVLFEKLSYFLRWEFEGDVYWGECGLLKGLSIDDRPDYEEKIKSVCRAISNGEILTLYLPDFPSIQCGIEMLQQAVYNAEPDLFFINDFRQKASPIPINGLVWMGDSSFMKAQIDDKIAKKFRCIKMKVGAIDWEEEKRLLNYMREQGGSDLVIRVDANGAWNNDDDTKRKLEFLGSIKVHSIEQVTAVGNHEAHIALNKFSPVSLALDEELFHYTSRESRGRLLDTLQLDFIVLKPSLVGGFSACDEWISLCEERGMDYWITSALESNVCLNAISQYTYDHKKDNFQGLGTGSLYENNIDSPLEIVGDEMKYNVNSPWNYDNILKNG